MATATPSPPKTVGLLADAVGVTVSATSPVAIPVIVWLTGSDVMQVAATPSFAVTVLPIKGVLSNEPPTLICTNVGTAATRTIGTVMTNCTGFVIYTPLLDATGTDRFSFTFTNGGETSVAAVATITLPAAP